MNRWSTKMVALAMLLAPLTGCSDGAVALSETTALSEAEQAVTNCSVVWQKELMITDVRVVKDARSSGMGPWSFGGIMRAMAGRVDEQAFVKKFVESWMEDQIVEGMLVKARPRMEEMVLAPWRARSAPGTYDLSSAPFDLQAIVYRVDLRRQKNVGAGAGEGRFIYGVRDGDGNMTPFTVIAEFGLPIQEGKSAVDWANDWHSLGQLELGSPAYNQRLEEITNRFASAAARAGMIPGTQLNQLRTNEIALDFGTGRIPVWELREFHIEADGLLHPARPALTPSSEYNGTNMLSTYVQQNARAIQQGTHNLPVKFRGVPFTAGAVPVPTPDFKWQVPGVTSELQEQFSTQTCSGCHAGDTGTRFLHVAPSFDGTEAQLSAFVVDQEMPRRTRELQKLLGCP